MRCLRPIYVRDTAFPHTFHKMQVPCGKCYACRMNQRTDWTTRNLLELQCSAWALFVTLTYDDEHCPRNEDGVLEVEKYDVQTWLKRLRKWLDKTYGSKVRYFLTSEYGEGLKRPHYHTLLYFPTLETRKIATFDAIEDTWGKGQVKFGDVEPASVHYCMKYLMKFDEEIDPLPSGINRPFGSCLVNLRLACLGLLSREKSITRKGLRMLRLAKSLSIIRMKLPSLDSFKASALNCRGTFLGRWTFIGRHMLPMKQQSVRSTDVTYLLSLSL